MYHNDDTMKPPPAACNGQVSAFLASYNSVVVTFNSAIAGVDPSTTLGMHLDNFGVMLSAHQAFAVGLIAEVDNKWFAKKVEHGQAVAAHAAERTRLEVELHETRQQLFASLGAARIPDIKKDGHAELDMQISPLLAAFNGDSWPSDDAIYDDWKRMSRGERWAYLLFPPCRF